MSADDLVAEFSSTSDTRSFSAFRYVRVINQSGQNITVTTGLQQEGIANGSSKVFTPGQGTVLGEGLTSEPKESEGMIPALSVNWQRAGGGTPLTTGSQAVQSVPFTASMKRVPTGTTTKHAVTFPEASITVGPGGAVLSFVDTAGDQANGAPDPEPDRKEMYLLLENKTGQDQTIMWGDKPLTLKPGLNQIRYDGPVDSNGLPLVAPGDFEGTYFDGGGNGSPEGVPQGTPYVYGTLDFHSSGEGVKWDNAYTFVPQGASAPSGVPWVEVISPQTATKGATVIKHGADGSRTITTLPRASGGGGGTSSTSGGGAVLSNPNLPPPVQNTTNTTNNVTNNITNTTNNTTTNNNVTNIDNNGQPTDSGDNSAEVDALPFDGDFVPDPDGAPTEDLKGSIESVQSAALSKFTNYRVFASGEIPRASTWTINLPIGGGYAPIQKTIDFTSTPFPQVRFAILVMLTLGLSVSFLKRITI